MSVAGMQHSEVVAAIKAGGDETRLLVVDIEAEEFFQKCNVMPTEEHISGTTLFTVSLIFRSTKHNTEENYLKQSETGTFLFCLLLKDLFQSQWQKTR